MLPGYRVMAFTSTDFHTDSTHILYIPACTLQEAKIHIEQAVSPATQTVRDPTSFISHIHSSGQTTHSLKACVIG